MALLFNKKLRNIVTSLHTKIYEKHLKNSEKKRYKPLL